MNSPMINRPVINRPIQLEIYVGTQPLMLCENRKNPITQLIKIAIAF